MLFMAAFTNKKLQFPLQQFFITPLQSNLISHITILKKTPLRNCTVLNTVDTPDAFLGAMIYDFLVVLQML